MARMRSPNYPSIGLPEAIKRVEQVFAKEHRHPAPREVVVKHMGFGGVNGASLGALSAAGKYGLLEVVGGQYRVSERMLAILHPNAPTEKIQAIAAAARAPDLFVEIFDSFPGAPPSDENLRSYLIRRGFSQSALGAVIQAFRETMELAPMAISAHPAGQHELEPEPGMSHGNPAPQPVRGRLLPSGLLPSLATSPRASPTTTDGRGSSVTHGVAESPRATLPLTEGTAALELPEALSEESLEDLREWIEMLLRAAERAAKRAKIAAQFNDPEYLARREAGLARAAGQTGDDENGN